MGNYIMVNEFNLVDVFWTFQGESFNWGKRALFIRLPFCNLKCSFCDTEFNKYRKYTLDELTRLINIEPSRFVVITGGEPAMNKQLKIIISILKYNKFEIAIETNGMFELEDGIDFIVCSPKKESSYEIHEKNYSKINDLKIVVDDNFDWNILKHFEEQGSKYNWNLWLSPEYGRLAESVKEIEEYISKNPQWRLNLQTHKFIGIK